MPKALLSVGACALITIGSFLGCAAERPGSAAPGTRPSPAAPAQQKDDRPPAERVSKESVVGFLRMLPQARAVRGTIEAQQGLIETEKLLVQQLREMGYEPRLQDLVWNLKYQQDQEAARKAIGPIYGGPKDPETTPELAANTWHNIIVEIPGRTKPDEVVIIGAHFDAVAGSPGADDNGSGTAALLELARVFKDRPTERTVRLIFFNLEEIGIRGAAEYAKSIMGDLNDGKQKLIGMVSLEMLGYFTDEPNSQKSPIPKIEGVFDPPTVGDFIGIATIQAFSEFARAFEKGMNKAAPKLKVVVADFAPVSPPDFQRSDHAPFMNLGYTAMMLTDTSNYRNPNYHKPSDTIDTLDLDRYTLVVKAVAGAVYDIANSHEPASGGEPPRAPDKSRP
jgi:aminopeptidase YwaD